MGIKMWFLLCFVATISPVFGSLFDVLNDVNGLSEQPYGNRNAKIRYFSDNQQRSDDSNGFSWSSCGSSSDIAHIQALNVAPDPLSVPGNVTVAASGSLKINLEAPIQVDLEVKKKMFIWITIPCVDDVGSCQYDDLCALVKTFKCPPEFKKYGLPCQCPIKAGNYNLPETTIPVDPVGIPKWAESGDYKATIKASYKGQQIMCLNLEFSLK